ncbi:MAG: hypothetical protein ACYC8T_15480 [Myxococcaceae bacterium]
MGKREAAREEAAFARGAVGVDGQATAAEEKDVAEVERDKAREQLLRGRTWLGREFLTWLLWQSESGDPVVELEGAGVVVLFVGKVVLRGLHGDVIELSAKGTLAPYSAQVRLALDAGLLLHSARVRFVHGERTWEASLDAEFLDVRSAKLPELLTEEEDDRISERLDLAGQLCAMVDRVLEAFVAVRASRSWSREVVPALKGWMRGEAEDPTDRLLGRAKAAKRG